MGLDLYSGSLKRFYARDFLTPLQKWARDNGEQQETILLGGSLSTDNADQVAIRFIDEIVSAGIELEHWDENAASYAGIQYPRDTVMALVNACVYTSMGQDAFPIWTGEEADYSSPEHYLESGAVGVEAHSVLPSLQTFAGRMEHPLGGMTVITSTSQLRADLETIRTNVFENEVNPARWIVEGPPNALKRGDSPERVRQSAQYAYGALVKMLAFSDATGLPIMFDE